MYMLMYNASSKFRPHTVAYPECAKRGGLSHILAEKRGVSFTLFQKMHENAIFSPIRGGGRTPGTPYDGPAIAMSQHENRTSAADIRNNPTNSLKQP